MASSLISDDCRSVAEANAMFATEKGLLVLRPGRACCAYTYFTIPSGCYALVTRHGADLDYESIDETKSSAVWPPGLHYFFPPWVRVSNLVTMQSIVLELPVKACKTRDNVTVNVDVSLVFRIMGDAARGEDPELVRRFVYQVKPRGLEQQLRDAQEEAVRGLARSMKHTQIYGIRSGGAQDKEKQADQGVGGDDYDKDFNYGADEFKEEEELEPSERDDVFVGSSDDQDRKAAEEARKRGASVAARMRARLNKQFVPQGVQILSVMIKSVTLPDEITRQMTEKTMVISQNAQQRMYHENEMQNTRMDQEIQTMLQSFHERREQENSAGAEIMNAENVKLNDAIAQADKAEAHIREDAAVDIDNLLAENALQVQRVRDSMYESVTTIKAEAEREAAELLANTRLRTQTLLSESELQATRNLAKAQEIVSTAEGKIAPWLEKKKEHETKTKQLRVYEKLAKNKDLVISGSVDETVNLLTVADAILQDMDETDQSSRSAVLAELALMSKGSAAFMKSATPNPGTA